MPSVLGEPRRPFTGWGFWAIGGTWDSLDLPQCMYATFPEQRARLSQSILRGTWADRFHIGRSFVSITDADFSPGTCSARHSVPYCWLHTPINSDAGRCISPQRSSIASSASPWPQLRISRASSSAVSSPVSSPPSRPSLLVVV